MHRAFILFTLSMGLAACAADTGGEGIFLSKNVAPEDGCLFNATATELFNPHGVYSLFARSGYKLFPQMISKISSREDNVEQRTIQVRGARVDLTFTDPAFSGISGDGLTHFESLFAAPIGPNGGITDGAFELIPTALTAAVASAKGLTPVAPPAVPPQFKTEVVAKVVVFGDLTGDEVVSQEFLFPVTLCSDCVVNVIGACPLAAGTMLMNAGNSCNPYQDGVADCCLNGNAVICPASITPM